MKIKGDVFRRKFQKAGIGKTDVVNDNKSLGEQMRFKLQLLTELNNAQRHDMANDVLLELYDMCDQVINVCPARKMGSLSDLI